MFGSMCMSWHMRPIHVVRCAADVAAMYSASHVDNAGIFCLREPQHIGVPLYVESVPDMDFQSLMSAAASTSEYKTRRFLGYSLPVASPAWNIRPVAGVRLGYRISRFSAVK